MLKSQSSTDFYTAMICQCIDKEQFSLEAQLLEQLGLTRE
jgi:hypothetical protein